MSGDDHNQQIKRKSAQRSVRGEACPEADLASARGDVLLVRKPPCRVAHQAHSLIPAPSGACFAIVDRLAKSFGSGAWKLGERSSDRVHYVSV